MLQSFNTQIAVKSICNESIVMTTKDLGSLDHAWSRLIWKSSYHMRIWIQVTCVQWGSLKLYNFLTKWIVVTTAQDLTSSAKCKRLESWRVLHQRQKQHPDIINSNHLFLLILLELSHGWDCSKNMRYGLMIVQRVRIDGKALKEECEWIRRPRAWDRSLFWGVNCFSHSGTIRNTTMENLRALSPIDT